MTVFTETWSLQDPFYSKIYPLHILWISLSIDACCNNIKALLREKLSMQCPKPAERCQRHMETVGTVEPPLIIVYQRCNGQACIQDHMPLKQWSLEWSTVMIGTNGMLNMWVHFIVDTIREEGAEHVDFYENLIHESIERPRERCSWLTHPPVLRYMLTCVAGQLLFLPNNMALLRLRSLIIFFHEAFSDLAPCLIESVPPGRIKSRYLKKYHQ